MPPRKNNVTLKAKKTRQSVADTSTSPITTRSSLRKSVNASSPSINLNISSVQLSTSPPTSRHRIAADEKQTAHTKKTGSKSQKSAIVLQIKANASNRTVSTRSSPLKASPSLSVEKLGNHSPCPVKRSPRKSTHYSPAVEVMSPRRAARKRILSTPDKSVQLNNKKLIHDDVMPLPENKVQIKSEDDCIILKELPSPSKFVSFPSPIETKIASEETKEESTSKSKRRQPVHKKDMPLPTDPELSGRFLRRKWFSLKTRGGFTCLRSAILSPEEIAQEVIQHTMVYTPKEDEANFFTTKLMVRLSSRLPPSRARPSCEELVELINSRQKQEKLEKQQPKGEGTAIRVKVERRSFSDTISQVTNISPKLEEDSATKVESPQSRNNGSILPARNEISKILEREIALNQLKNMRYWRGGQYRY